MRYAPLAGVRIERNTCTECRKMTDVAEWWVSISGYEHVEYKCLECGFRWPNFVEGDHPDLFRVLQEAGLRRSQ